MTIINGLPTSTVAGMVEDLRPRLYINFFHRLPAEVCLKILGYLDPVSLVHTAQASREWMSVAYDWKLWQHLYYLEGWRMLPDQIRAFEAELEAQYTASARTRPGFHGDDEHASKRRATPQTISATLHKTEEPEMMDVDSVVKSPVQQQTSLFGPSSKMVRSTTPENTELFNTPDSTIRNLRLEDSSFSSSRSKGKSREESASGTQDSTVSTTSQSNVTSNIGQSSLVVRDRKSGKQKLNWQYLYTQRRRLEANWENARYVNFQLPHPDFPEEAHEECIYTLQHTGKYLVSGSRDKTLRIWDLETRRLVRPPLTDHIGSVLCLQFDASPEEDIIVSGSSDATVVIWRFSTGQVIQRLKRAHRESVLNVRFDRRILVTCSKDKKIKIFNRRPMGPNDLGYPHGGALVDPVPISLNNFGYEPSPMADLPIKPPYSLIGCLEGHGAAVNAVQIFDNEIVSASGDRTVKIWDWPSQTCHRTLIGHMKGIACVQYDGRRVVSGSSDNEVKVFDKESGLEVASLRTHSNLVRTVQAGFGDLPYSFEEDQEDAKQIDNEFFRAVDSGTVSRTTRLNRGRPRNAGSRKPEDITAYGAKLPPGGGGGRWGRIVSGSYDETIIIWRRDKEGAWRAQQVLRQEDAAAAASRTGTLPRPPRPAPAPAGTTANAHPTTSTASAPPAATGLPPGVPLFPPVTQDDYHRLIDATIPHGYLALRQLLQRYPQTVQFPYLQIAIANEGSSAARVALRHEVHRSVQFQASVAHNSHAPPPPPPAAAGQPAVPATAAVQATPQAVQAAPQAHPHFPQGSMARVFKLQFDARRIICCSQTSVIVGWDFANGDEKIIEASRFFAPIE